MNNGWMWQDWEGTLEERIERGAARYEQKFGHKPNRCMINAIQWTDEEPSVEGIKVIKAQNCLKDCFFLLCASDDPDSGR